MQKLAKKVAQGVSRTITNGVTIPYNRFIPPGSLVTNQTVAEKLPLRVGSPYEKINSFVIHVNKEITKGNNAKNITKLATEVEDQIEERDVQTQSPTGIPFAENSV